MTLSGIVLKVFAVMFVLYGVAYVILPDAIERFATGSAFGSAGAVTDARAIYGGMALGVASLFWLTSRGGRDVRRVGLVGAALTFGFIAAARSIGIVIDGHGTGLMYAILAAELLGVALSIWALKTAPI